MKVGRRVKQREELGSMAAAIGLGIETMRAVNLLVHERHKRRAPSKLALAGVASSSAVLMLLGAGYVNAHGTVQRRQVALDELKTRLAALPRPKPAATSNVDAKLVAEKAARVSVLSSALSTRVRWDRLFRELSIVLPGDVWLDTMDATAPTAATAGSVVAAPPPVAGTAAPAPGRRPSASSGTPTTRRASPGS